MRHGTESSYSNGCRCEPCKAGHRDYNRKWRQRPAQVRKRQIKVLAKVSAEAARIAALDAEVERLRRTLTSTPKMEWEIQRDIRRERDALLLKVADLEAQIDRMIDAAVDVETRGGSSPYLCRPVEPKVGRPRKVPR